MPQAATQAYRSNERSSAASGQGMRAYVLDFEDAHVDAKVSDMPAPSSPPGHANGATLTTPAPCSTQTNLPPQLLATRRVAEQATHQQQQQAPPRVALPEVLLTEQEWSNNVLQLNSAGLTRELMSLVGPQLAQQQQQQRQQQQQPHFGLRCGGAFEGTCSSCPSSAFGAMPYTTARPHMTRGMGLPSAAAGFDSSISSQVLLCNTTMRACMVANPAFSQADQLSPQQRPPVLDHDMTGDEACAAFNMEPAHATAAVPQPPSPVMRRVVMPVPAVVSISPSSIVGTKSAQEGQCFTGDLSLRLPRLPGVRMRPPSRRSIDVIPQFRGLSSSTVPDSSRTSLMASTSRRCQSLNAQQHHPWQLYRSRSGKHQHTSAAGDAVCAGAAGHIKGPDHHVATVCGSCSSVGGFHPMSMGQQHAELDPSVTSSVSACSAAFSRNAASSIHSPADCLRQQRYMGFLHETGENDSCTQRESNGSLGLGMVQGTQGAVQVRVVGWVVSTGDQEL